MSDTQQVNIRLPKATVRLIDALVELETYGDDRTEVIYRFIDAGIKQAQKDNDLPRGPEPSKKVVLKSDE